MAGRAAASACGHRKVHSRATENRATNSRCVCVFGARIAGRSYHHGGVRSPERSRVGGGQGQVRGVRSLGSGARQAEGGCRCQQQHRAEPEERARRALPTRKTDAKRCSAPAQAAQRQPASSADGQRTSAALSSSNSSSSAAAAAAKRASWRCAVVGEAREREARGRVRRCKRAGARSVRPRSACAAAVRVACCRTQHAPAQPRVLSLSAPPSATRRSSRPRAQAQPCRCGAAGHTSVAASKLAQTHTQARECALQQRKACEAAATHVRSTGGPISADAAKSSSAGSSSMPLMLRPRLSIAQPRKSAAGRRKLLRGRTRCGCGAPAARRSWTGAGCGLAGGARPAGRLEHRNHRGRASVACGWPAAMRLQA